MAFEADETMAAQALVAAGVGVTIFPRLGAEPAAPGRGQRARSAATPRFAESGPHGCSEGYRSPASDAMLQILVDVAEDFRANPPLAAVS